MNEHDDDIRTLVRSAAESISVADRRTQIFAGSPPRRRTRVWLVPISAAAAIAAVLVAVAVLRQTGPSSAPVATQPISTNTAESSSQQPLTVADCDPDAQHHQVPEVGEGLSYDPGTLTLTERVSSSLLCWYEPKAQTPKAILESDLVRPIAAFAAPRQHGNGVPEYWGLLSNQVARLELVCEDLVVNFVPNGSGATGTLIAMGPAIGFVSPIGIAADHPKVELIAYDSKGTEIDRRAFQF